MADPTVTSRSSELLESTAYPGAVHNWESVLVQLTLLPLLNGNTMLSLRRGDSTLRIELPPHSCANLARQLAERGAVGVTPQPEAA